jgi:hypothetical protein
MAAASPHEHLGYFTTFAVGLIAQFERYLQGPDRDPHRDGVGYRRIVLNLTDEELDELAAAMNATVARFVHPPGDGRRRRTLATVTMPQDDT